MLNPTGNIHLFTREDDRSSFTFQGWGIAAESEDTQPVKIRWTIHDTPPIAPPANHVLQNRASLESRHYIRKADPDADYWFGFEE